MVLKRSTLERTLELATASQKALEQKLGGDAQSLKKNPQWRSLDADRRQVINRLNSLTAVEVRDAEVLKRKSEATAGKEVK